MLALLTLKIDMNLVFFRELSKVQRAPLGSDISTRVALFRISRTMTPMPQPCGLYQQGCCLLLRSLPLNKINSKTQDENLVKYQF